MTTLRLFESKVHLLAHRILDGVTVLGLKARHYFQEFYLLVDDELIDLVQVF
jgi:hypothetical protein